MRVESFSVRLPRPDGPLLEWLGTALAVDGEWPLRWAIVQADAESVVIEGARVCSASPI